MGGRKLEAKAQLLRTKKEETETSSDESNTSDSSVRLNSSVFNSEDLGAVNDQGHPREEPSLDNVLDRAFEESVENNINPTMAGPEYQAIRDEIEMVELTVVEVISDNRVEALADKEDLMEYKEWIKSVEDPFHQFRNLINQVIVKRPPGVDDAEIAYLNEK